MSRRTLTLIIFLTIVTLLLLFIAVKPTTSPYQAPSFPQQNTNVSPTPNPAKTTLQFSPNPLTMASSSGSLAVNIDTGTNKVTGIQLELSYDPKVISVTSIEKGTFLENPITLLNSINSTSGRVSYAIANAPSGRAKVGSGIVATLNITVINPSVPQTMISFLPKSVVSAEGISPSVLKTTTPATIMLTGNATSPTNTTKPLYP